MNFREERRVVQADRATAGGRPAAQSGKGLGFFEQYLTLWVALCIVAGIAIGQWWPAFPETLSRFSYYQVSIPVAVLIWMMIYPMMVQIDFCSVRRVGKQPKGLMVTLVVNWLIKPFTMFAIAWLFLKVIFARWIPHDLAMEYIAGALPHFWCRSEV